MKELYDVIVVGAGHAGCEAALAAARMGCQTLLLTMNLDNIALMPCNPSIGGPAKGHVVREIDALGGEMARNTDKTFIQIRKLNASKGPAVQALRAQSDKLLYSREMKHTLERQENLYLKQALVEEIGMSEAGGTSPPAADAPTNNEPCNSVEARRPPRRMPLPADEQHYLWVKTHTDAIYQSKTLILTTGTSLGGRVIIGDRDFAAGRSGEFGAYKLSESLRALGLTLGRLKTGTPPRIDARTIDFTQTILHPGSPDPLYFSFQGEKIATAAFADSNPAYPPGPEIAWRRQLPCYLVHTNEKTHEVIRANLHRAPLFTGFIKGKGPRYCPSIEDKVVRFAHHSSHGLFLEPEGWETNEVYVQGANTSLPEDVQLALLRTIPALSKVEIMRVGYAIEYDYVPPSQISASLEVRKVPGLFLAGQINGTTGYEEAAGQGLMAGINAALKVKGKETLILRRDQAYIGVMIDDLITREHTEPYRLFTSRAEYRLLLRGDNSDLRLSPTGYQLGLISGEIYQNVENKRQLAADFIKYLEKRYLSISEGLQNTLARYGTSPVTTSTSLADFLCRPEIDLKKMREMGLIDGKLSTEVEEQVEIEVKYKGYLERQRWTLDRMKKLEERPIPSNIDYSFIQGLRQEARQRLERFRPATLGQAYRLEGVTPADIAILLVNLEKGRIKIHAAE